MNRELILDVLGKLPTEQLLKALAVSGADVQGGDGGGDFLSALSMDGAGSNNRIQSWNDRTVKMGGGDRPAIADKKWAQGAGDVSQAQNPRVGQIDDGVDPTNIFLQTGGGS